MRAKTNCPRKRPGLGRLHVAAPGIGTTISGY